MPKSEWTCWAFVGADGSMFADTFFSIQDSVWDVALGWPNAEDIQEAKKRGCRVCRVRVTEIDS